MENYPEDIFIQIWVLYTTGCFPIKFGDICCECIRVVTLHYQMVETGWNLLDHVKGYPYCFAIHFVRNHIMPCVECIFVLTLDIQIVQIVKLFA